SRRARQPARHAGAHPRRVRAGRRLPRRHCHGRRVMTSVYRFGGGVAQGGAGDKMLLGGKGANLFEMTALGIPVPPGFTITTEVSRHVMANGGYPDGLAQEVE